MLKRPNFPPISFIAWTVVLLLVVQLLIYGSFRFHTAGILTHQATTASRQQMESRRADLAAKGLALNPYNGLASFHFAYGRLLGGDAQQASTAFRDAAIYMPHKGDVFRGWAQACLLSKDWQGLTSNLKDYFRLVPKPQTQATYFLRITGQGALRIAQYGVAEYFLTSAAYADNKVSPESLGSKVFSSLRLRNFRSAAYAHVAARAFVPTEVYDPDDLTKLKNPFDPSSLMEFFNIVCRLDPDNFGAAVALGNYYLSHKLIFAAEAIIHPVYQRFPSDPEVSYLWGNINFLLKKPEIAKEAFDRHLESFPDSPNRMDITQKLGALAR